MTYPFTEHATVLEGEVELTVAGGEPQRFAPGDSWFVKQGTEVEWKILTPRFVKHYGERRDALTRCACPGRGRMPSPGRVRRQPPPGRNRRNVARRMAPVFGVMLFIHPHIHRRRHRIMRRPPPSGRYSLSRMPA